ncbi:MAG: hypothetical protein HFJ93_04325 [Muribaculaceae bacterium]|jgi:hypothetical protein|nr:hypothetical protein [Muribaculaceae bacterium]
MKLIITSVATAALALTIVSCSTQERAQHSEMSLASKIENASNPDSVKAYVNSAKEHIDKLIADGDLVAAKAYLDSIQPVVEKKDPAMVHIFTPTKAEMAKAEAKAAAEDAAEAMREGADTVASKASDLLDKTTEAAKATAKNAADKGAEIVDKTKEKGADIVDKAKDKGQDLTEKAKDAVKKAKEEAKEKAEDIRKAVDDK